MIGSDEYDTTHAECRNHLFFRSEGDSGFRVQIDPCSHRDRPHTVLLIDKYWLQAAILVMSSSETIVRQLQCERSDETLMLAAFLCADSVIRERREGGHRSREVCGVGEHWNETAWQIIQRQPEM